MNNSEKLKAFEQAVKNKFDVYNSLFLNLPFRGIGNIGMLIPLLQHVCKQGLVAGRDPLEILDAFFDVHTGIRTEKEKIDFMFHVIRYVERQIVLYDSAEDAAFEQLVQLDDHLSLKDCLTLLAADDKSCSLSDDLSCFSARLVFTAHPTQFYSPSVLNIIGQLRALIARNDIDLIDLKLQQLGLTSLINARKPTPFDEAQNIIYLLRHVYYEAVGELYAMVKKTVRDSCFDCPAIVQLGFWPGGDRDGNPFVTAETTTAVADELRMNLMKCYYQDVRRLSQKLTFKGVEDVLEKLRDRLYMTMFDPEQTIRYEEIVDPLADIKASLIENYNSLYLDELEILMDKVTIFKTHFAALDIRQNHDVHRDTVEAILRKKNLIAQGLDELGNAERIALLLREDIAVDPEEFEDALIKDTIQTIIEMKDIQRKNGSEGCNRYIISHAEDIYCGPVCVQSFTLVRVCAKARCRSTSSRCSSRWKACRTPAPSCRPSLTSRNTGRISFSAGTGRPSCWGFRTAPKTAGICRPTGRSIPPRRPCRRFAVTTVSRPSSLTAGAGRPRGGAGKPIAFMRRMVRILPIMPSSSPFKARRLPACMAPKRISSIIANSC